MKVKVMGLNPGYLLKSFLLYINLEKIKNAAYAITGNENSANMMKSIWKKIVKSHQMNLL